MEEKTIPDMELQTFNQEVENPTVDKSTDKDKISNNQALLHMVKATIGGGFLAMPEAFHNAGIIFGTIGTIILGLSVLNMMSFIVRCSQALRSGKYAATTRTNRRRNDTDDDNGDNDQLSPDSGTVEMPPSMDYPDTVAAVFRLGARGHFARWAPFAGNFTSAVLVTTYYGVNIIYVCIVASTLKQLVDQYTAHAPYDSWSNSVHGLSIRWYPALAGMLIIPVGMVRSIKYLVPFSFVANTCLMAGAGAIFYFIFAGDDEQDPLGPEERAKLIVWPATRWTLFAGSALCSLEGVGMLLHVENSMKNPLELAGPPSYTLHKSMVIIIAFNGALGLFGYLRYGDRCSGSISLNLPADNILSEATKVLISLGILLTYGLQLTVTADLAWQGLRGKLIRSVGELDAVSDVTKVSYDPSRTEGYYYAMRFLLILGTILVATVVPDIGPLVSLVGSVGFSLLGMIVPVFMETVWYWYPKDDDESGGNENEQNNWSDVDLTETSAGNSDLRSEKGFGMFSVPGKITVATSNRRRSVRRVVRHVKNAILLSFGLCALIGGAYYNILVILDSVGDDKSAQPPASLPPTMSA